MLSKIDDKEILQEKPTSGDMKIILVRWRAKGLQDKIQYTTWSYNSKAKTTHQGNYYAKLRETYQDYQKRV